MKTRKRGKKKAVSYTHIAVTPKTKQRFLKEMSGLDTADSFLNELLNLRS